jgi:uncharacterized protein YsxB (DUF464 family)
LISVTFVNISFGSGSEIDLNSEFVKIIIKGHSLFDSKGKDIVCAAVSALSLSAVKAITVSAKIPQSTEQNEGFLKTEIFTKDLKSKAIEFKTLLDVLLIGLFEIKKLYPDKIEVDFITEK